MFFPYFELPKYNQDPLFPGFLPISLGMCFAGSLPEALNSSIPLGSVLGPYSGPCFSELLWAADMDIEIF